MNKIEQVARALCRQNYNNLSDEMIKSIEDKCWKAYIPPAAVAIKAMLEPTEEMIKASPDQPCRDAYNAMISEALK